MSWPEHCEHDDIDRCPNPPIVGYGVPVRYLCHDHFEVALAGLADMLKKLRELPLPDVAQ